MCWVDMTSLNSSNSPMFDLQSFPCYRGGN